MKFLAGILTCLVLLGVGAAAVAYSGAFDFAASRPPSALEKRVAGFALDHSVAKRAPNAANPHGKSPDAIRVGMAHYKEMCVFCHGAPGVDASEAGEGLNPPAPDLTGKKTQARSDGELFWIVQHGIRMTGMPAFGPTHKDEEIWKIVSFMRHLPELTPDEERALKAGGEEGGGGAEEHHHGSTTEP
jgi:mono/diheme cytochrome c family protein